MNGSAETHQTSGQQLGIGVFVLVGAICQMTAGFLPDILGWEQTIETRADAVRNPLTPWGAAFLIWPPLFAGSIWFAIRLLQKPPSAGSALALVALPMGIAYWINTAYSLASPLLGNQALSSFLVVLILVPSLFAILRARGVSAQTLSDRVALAAVHAFIGWITVAATVSLAGILNALEIIRFEAEPTAALMFVLAIGATLGVWIGLITKSVWYSVAVAWGLFWLSVEALIFSDRVAPGVLAALGCIALTIVGFLVRRKRPEATIV